MNSNPASWLSGASRIRATSGTREAEEDVYFPHPAPNAAGNEDQIPERMGSTLSLLKVRMDPEAGAPNGPGPY